VTHRHKLVAKPTSKTYYAHKFSKPNVALGTRMWNQADELALDLVYELEYSMDHCGLEASG